MPIAPSTARVFALTAAALVGFAANSLLCRAALGAQAIDAASFTAIRLVTGAAVLLVLARARGGPAVLGAGSWSSGAALFAYAAAFSYAYLRLGAGTGALILFGLVQATMIGWGLWRGERPRPLEWLGLATAAAGLVALTLPGLAAPDPAGAALMAGAGVAWGVYSLRGRGVVDPLAATADNFARSLAPAVALLAVALVVDGASLSARGVALAAASGGLASGVGYSLWYAALPHLSATRAAIVQLIAPVLAALGGVTLLAETIDAPRAIAGAAIVGGVALAVLARRTPPGGPGGASAAP